MSPDTVAGRRPMHLWIVGILSLLWNSVGAFDYLAWHLKLDWYLSQSTPEQLAYFASFPAWSVAAWAFGVWGAFAGSLCLLFRNRCAVWAFAVSLTGLAVSTLYQFVLSDGRSIMGDVALWFNGVIWLIAILLLWYAIRQRKNGVLR